ncbi:Hypothetical predicted protein, partial [Pelobates cultripes]
MDRTDASPEPVVSNEEDDLLRSVLLRLALYGPKPPADIITQVMAAADTEAREK